MQTLKNTAAQVLARAVKLYFPQSCFVEAGIDRLGFYVDFALETAFDKAFLPRILDKMKALLSQKEPFRLLHMKAHLARSYLKKAGFFERNACRVPQNEILSLLEWKGVATIIEGDVCAHPDQISHFTLLTALLLEEGITRIHGVIFDTSNLLNDFLKRWRNHEAKGHVILGKRKDFFSPLSEKRWLWHPQGVAKLHELKTLWHEQVTQEGFAFFAGGSGKEALEILKGPLVSFCSLEDSLEIGPQMGLFATEKSEGDRVYLRSSQEKLHQNCIWLLNFIRKFHKLLGFECQWVMSLPTVGGTCSQALAKRLRDALVAGIELENFTEAVRKERCASLTGFVSDRLGRLWEIPFLSLEPMGEEVFIEGSVFGRLEWVIALLLEADLIDMRQVKH